jgi:hypothetical protein
MNNHLQDPNLWRHPRTTKQAFGLEGYWDSRLNRRRAERQASIIFAICTIGALACLIASLFCK